jgi:hypothetical protein
MKQSAGMSGMARQQAEGAVAGASHLHAALGAAEICRRRVPLRTVLICNKHSVVLWGALPQSADLSSPMRADNRYSSKHGKLGLAYAAKDPLQWHLGCEDQRNRSETCAAETDTMVVVLVTIVDLQDQQQTAIAIVRCCMKQAGHADDSNAAHQSEQ